MQIRPFQSDDMDDIVELSLLAWEPVFTAWERILGSELYPLAISTDWRSTQKEGVKKVCLDEKFTTWVADVDGNTAGFISFILNDETKIGVVELLAVHPGYQNQGVGTALNLAVLQKMKDSGMKVAEVGTGGDEGHAPARAAYEKVGYIGLPTVHYYKAL